LTILSVSSSLAKIMPKKVDLEEVSQKTGLRPQKIREILWFLYQNKRIENQELVRETGLPKSMIRDFLKNLQTLLKKPSQYVVLNQTGKQFVESEMIGSTSEEVLKKPLFNQLKRFSASRPKPKRNLDQFPATLETVIKRVFLIQKRGDLGGKRVLFLGDYDLTSVALALLGSAKRVVVADIDRDLLRLIEKITQREKLKIKSLHYDAKASLLRGLRNSFDVVFSDPPYTPNGFKVFLSRAVEAAGENEATFYFCYGYSDRARERGLEAQKIISQLGLLIEEKLQAFNRYQGAESIGSRSSLYILKTTPKTKIIIKGRFKGPIYTGQKRK
jgi:predicted methyltransferase